ncbi:MAG: hypothetical protein N3A66_10710, partial [Planctomycetota bacterium]|nr:hypothetical protein [Planctomycetota bacterium]
IVAGQKYTLYFSGGGASVGIYCDSRLNPYPGGRSGFNASRDYLFETIVAEPAPEAMPYWLTLTDRGNNTAALAGTPPETEIGRSFALTIAAADSLYTT